MGESPNILTPAVQLLRPRPVMDVDAWAEATLPPPRNSAFATGTRLTLLSYQRGEWGPLWAFRRYSDLLMLWAAQLGKSVVLQIMFAYIVAVEPGPTMLVFPRADDAKRRSKDYLQPWIRDAAPLACHLTDVADDFSLFLYAFRHMTAKLTHAGSPAALAAESIQHLFKDELGKFPGSTTTEAGAEELADQRTKAFGEFAHRVACTTPTVATGPGWRDWKYSTQCQFGITCPKCREWRPLYFGDADRKVLEPDNDTRYTGGVKWPREEGIGREEAAAAAWWECECGERLNDYRKNQLVVAGTWRPRHRAAGRYACQAGSILSPKVTLAYMVKRWWAAFRDADKRHDFLNSELGIPFEAVAERIEARSLRDHVDAMLKPGVLPAAAVAVFLTADLMKYQIRYRLRAWGPADSWGLQEGSLAPITTAAGEQVPNWPALESIRARTWKFSDGEMGVTATLIDAGYETAQVYQYALAHTGEVWPTLGRDATQLRELVRYTTESVLADPANQLPLGGVVQKIVFAADHFKDQLANRLKVLRGQPGYWAVEPWASPDFFEEMQGESKVEKRDSRGRPVFIWERQGPNHVFDDEVLQMVAAHVFEVAARQPETSAPAAHAAPPPSRSDHVINPYTNRSVR